MAPTSNENTVKTFVLLAGLTGLLVVIGGAIKGGVGATVMLGVSLVVVGAFLLVLRHARHQGGPGGPGIGGGDA